MEPVCRDPTRVRPHEKSVFNYNHQYYIIEKIFEYVAPEPMVFADNCGKPMRPNIGGGGGGGGNGGGSGVELDSSVRSDRDQPSSRDHEVRIDIDEDLPADGEDLFGDRGDLAPDANPEETAENLPGLIGNGSFVGGGNNESANPISRLVIKPSSSCVNLMNQFTVKFKDLDFFFYDLNKKSYISEHMIFFCREIKRQAGNFAQIKIHLCNFPYKNCDRYRVENLPAFQPGNPSITINNTLDDIAYAMNKIVTFMHDDVDMERYREAVILFSASAKHVDSFLPALVTPRRLD